MRSSNSWGRKGERAVGDEDDGVVTTAAMTAVVTAAELKTGEGPVQGERAGVRLQEARRETSVVISVFNLTKKTMACMHQ